MYYLGVPYSPSGLIDVISIQVAHDNFGELFDIRNPFIQAGVHKHFVSDRPSMG